MAPSPEARSAPDRACPPLPCGRGSGCAPVPGRSCRRAPAEASPRRRRLSQRSISWLIILAHPSVYVNDAEFVATGVATLHSQDGTAADDNIRSEQELLHFVG